jgi:hypothetical protein
MTDLPSRDARRARCIALHHRDANATADHRFTTRNPLANHRFGQGSAYIYNSDLRLCIGFFDDLSSSRR